MGQTCPHCGHNLVKDAAIHRVGDLEHDPRGIMTWRGERVQLTPAECSIAAMLFREAPRILPRDALLLGLDTDAEGEMLPVLILRIRRKFTALSGVNPIENIRSRGYRWTGLSQ